MFLTENSDQVFLPRGCNRTQNLRFGPYTTRKTHAFITERLLKGRKESNQTNKNVIFKLVSLTVACMFYDSKDRPEVIKLFSCSTHLGMPFIMLIHIKMPTIVGI